jgi:uncharacterized membrane protein
MHSCTAHRLLMISRLLSLVNLTAALGAGLVAGVFFAFSSFVLPALARLPQLQGVTAMQSINVVVLNRSFLGVFIGTALASAALAADGLVRWSEPGARLRLVGGACYLLGSLLVTRACNVPWNDALALLAPHGRNAARAWAEYVGAWSFWNHVRAGASLLAAFAFTLALTGCSRYWECAPPDSARQKQLPEKLSETGLFAAGEPERLADGVMEFKPQFELWSDGALKRRFVRLPEGEHIDTSELDNWAFPIGTTFWKEFTAQGVRVETRLLRKIGAGAEDWATVAYVWQADGAEALATPNGKTNARGTEHDVPAAGECMACHGGRKSFALGFSAVQLAYDAGPDQLDLAKLVSRGLLTVPPPPAGDLVVPGDAATRLALGYLHANCGHCHNQDRPAAAASRCYDPDNQLDYWLSARSLATADATPAYRTAKGFAFEPGAPDDSRMLELMSQRGFLRQMPPLGTERVDARGVALIREWISNASH